MTLTSLHTSSAAESPLRLVEMQVEPFLVANTLTGVVSQRLVRRLCATCRRPAPPAEVEVLWSRWPLGPPPADGTVWRSGGGCARCRGTGYAGRTAVTEVMEVGDAAKLAILRGCTAAELEALAVADAMTTIRDDAILKVLAGETSLEEVQRVVT